MAFRAADGGQESHFGPAVSWAPYLLPSGPFSGLGPSSSPPHFLMLFYIFTRPAGKKILDPPRSLLYTHACFPPLARPSFFPERRPLLGPRMNRCWNRRETVFLLRRNETLRPVFPNRQSAFMADTYFFPAAELQSRIRFRPFPPPAFCKDLTPTRLR